MVQKAPIHQSHVYGKIKISQTIFEKGHPRNVPVKLFQNLTSSCREEDFLRISSCQYSARSPNSLEPCLWTDQNLANSFWKGLPKEHSCEIISKSDQRFQRRFLKNRLKKFLFVAMATRVFDGIKFVNNFWRGPPKEHSCQVWSKLVQQFWGIRCLKKLLMTDNGHSTTLKTPSDHVA